MMAKATTKTAAAKKSDAKTIKITQTGSPIRRHNTQRATLVGLGLNKMHRTVEVTATPEVMGQVRKVQHLLKVEG